MLLHMWMEVVDMYGLDQQAPKPSGGLLRLKLWGQRQTMRNAS